MESGFALFRRYFDTPAALTIEWNDAGSGARGWLVINSLRGGAAGGGTRMDPAGECATAKFLAKTMEIKFQVAGPPIGGAKSVLQFDPSDKATKREVLARWFRHIRPLLREYYGTGGDLNVDMDQDVVPHMKDVVGVVHPQYGVIAGHYRHPSPAAVADHLKAGLEQPASGGVVASVASGYSVVVALQRYYARIGDALAGKRVIIEGLGSVGGSAAWYLHQAGARVVAVATGGTERTSYRVATHASGLNIPEVLGSLVDKRLPSSFPDAETSRELWTHPADVFVPAAASETVTSDVLGFMRQAGVKVLASGANDPFKEETRGETALQEQADREFDILPDFVANCGTARAFSYLMDPDAPNDAASILAAVDASVTQAIDPLVEADRAPGQGILDRAYRTFVTPLVSTP
jgi:glutamate dehydrogenase (NAD(P)+)